jgi:hypothetical protein
MPSFAATARSGTVASSDLLCFHLRHLGHAPDELPDDAGGLCRSTLDRLGGCQA